MYVYMLMYVYMHIWLLWEGGGVETGFLFVAQAVLELNL